MDVLPNNLGDFPPGKSFRDQATPWPKTGFVPGQLAGRLAAMVVIVLLLGGGLGFGAYRLVLRLDESAPPPPSLLTPAQDDPAPDVAASPPTDATSPGLVVTWL